MVLLYVGSIALLCSPRVRWLMAKPRAVSANEQTSSCLECGHQVAEGAIGRGATFAVPKCHLFSCVGSCGKLHADRLDSTRQLQIVAPDATSRGPREFCHAH